jgi:hypothetical protein
MHHKTSDYLLPNIITDRPVFICEQFHSLPSSQVFDYKALGILAFSSQSWI